MERKKVDFQFTYFIFLFRMIQLSQKILHLKSSTRFTRPCALEQTSMDYFRKCKIFTSLLSNLLIFVCDPIMWVSLLEVSCLTFHSHKITVIEWVVDSIPIHISRSRLLFYIFSLMRLHKWWVWFRNFWPGSGQFFVAWLRSDQLSLVWVWKISTKNANFFYLFPFESKKSLWVGSKSTRVEGRLASYLLQVKSTLGLGQGPSLGNIN